MKTLITTFTLSLTLVACGVDSSSTEISTATQAPVTQKKTAVANDATQLTDARKDILAKAYLELDTETLESSRISDELGDLLFVRFSVSDVLRSARLSRPVTILVPTGTKARPVDANRVAEFYVVFDGMESSAETTYGPFPLFGVEGSACGGFVGLSCREGLSCHNDSHVADSMGICEVTE